MKNSTLIQLVLFALLASGCYPDQHQVSAGEPKNAPRPAVDSKYDFFCRSVRQNDYSNALAVCNQWCREDTNLPPRLASAVVCFLSGDASGFEQHKREVFGDTNSLRVIDQFQKDLGSCEFTAACRSLYWQSRGDWAQALSCLKSVGGQQTQLWACIQAACVKPSDLKISATMNVRGSGPMGNDFLRGITTMFPEEGYTALGTIGSSVCGTNLEATVEGISFLSRNPDVTRANCCGWGLKVVDGQLVLNGSEFDTVVKQISELYPRHNARIFPLRYDGYAFLVKCDKSKGEVFILQREIFGQ